MFPKSRLKLNRFFAINYGRPCNIHENDWDVKMPSNIDDMSATCPSFESFEFLENGTQERVTILSYQRYKFKLYQIASSITEGIYFYDGGTMQEVVEKVKLVNQRLLDWDGTLPPELRLKFLMTDLVEGVQNPR